MSGSSLKKKTPANPQFGLLWKSKEIIVLDLKLTVMIYQLQSRNLLHSALTRPSSANARRLKSRHPFVPAAQQLISSSDNNNNIHAAQWADHQWNAEWAENPQDSAFSSPTPAHTHPGMTFPRRAWVRLNRLRTGVGRFRSCLFKWGTASFAACECGAEEQTVYHVVLQRPIHQPPHGLHGLTVLDDETTEWLFNICPEIYCGQPVV